MSRLGRLAVIGVLAASFAGAACAQPAGYGAPPPAYRTPAPAQAYPPPGTRCRARFASGQTLICPMRVSKPVGAPCRCIAPPPPAGYPPDPAVPGTVVR